MAFIPFTEEDRPTMAAFNEKFQQAIATASEDAISKSAKVAFGSYIGTGKVGKENPNSISLPFDPKAVIITGDEGGMLIWTGSSLTVGNPYQPVYPSRIVSKGKIFSWYNDSGNAIYQCNDTGKNYYYIAFC